MKINIELVTGWSSYGQTRKCLTILRPQAIRFSHQPVTNGSRPGAQQVSIRAVPFLHNKDSAQGVGWRVSDSSSRPQHRTNANSTYFAIETAEAGNGDEVTTRDPVSATGLAGGRWFGYRNHYQGYSLSSDKCDQVNEL